MIRTGSGMSSATYGERTVLTARRSRGRSRRATHPFQVRVRQKPDAPGVYQWGVVYDSSLFLSRRPNHKQAITGLLSEDLTSGWSDMIASDAIWLGIVWNRDGDITFCGIDSWGDGKEFDLEAEAWSGSNAYIEDDGDETDPVHQTSRIIIAYSVTGETGAPVLDQVLTSNLVLEVVIVDGRPAYYPATIGGAGYKL